MDRGVRAIVSHRLPNAKELEAGCGDWLECCQAYLHAEDCPALKHGTQAGEVSAAPVVETGWLLEKMQDGQIWYVTVDQLITWTTDPLKALRLSRREDADMLAEIVVDCERIEEHQWG